jgi:glycosyltransferase involved in cell wall biosynthesis
MNRERVSGLVSVVVASYNHAEYLRRRMDSLLSQTYQDIEILVIDDCSPDSSMEVLREYEGRAKVRLIAREKNGGWVTVSNQGIDLTSGEYVLFANCDDECEPQMIERLVDGMKAHVSAGIVFCRSRMIDSDGRKLSDDFVIRERHFRDRCAKDTLLSGAEATRFLLHSCVIPNLSAALFRRECFDRVGVLSPAFRVCCDWDLFFRVAAQYDIAYIAAPLNRFRQHETTIRSATKDRIVYDEYFRMLLGQAARPCLSGWLKARTRLRVMYLWAVHLTDRRGVGLSNFPHHLRTVVDEDVWALVFFIPGLLVRMFECFVKAARSAAPCGKSLNRNLDARLPTAR